MNAWTSDAIPPKYLQARTPLERQGALVLQDKQCRNCHQLDGVGAGADRRWIPSGRARRRTR